MNSTLCVVIPAPGGNPEPLRHSRAATQGAWIPASRGNDVKVHGPCAVSDPKLEARNDTVHHFELGAEVGQRDVLTVGEPVRDLGDAIVQT